MGQASVRERLMELSGLRALDAFVQKLCKDFGARFVLMLASTYFGVKGFLYQLVTTGMLPFFKQELGVSGKAYGRYQIVAFAPWGMKAWLGSVSDIFPVRGYHKRYYIVGAALVGTAAVFGLATLPVGAGAAALLFFASMMEQATADLLCEGKYAEMMVARPETGSSLVSWVWGVYHLGGVFAACMLGPLIEAIGPRAVWWIAVPFAAQVIIPAFLGWLPEQRVDPGPKLGLLRQHPRVFFLAFLMAAAALAHVGVELAGGDTAQFVYAIVVSALLCAMGFWALPRQLAVVNVYTFLQEALYIQMAGATDYFYTADEECLPGGPGFGWTFYVTYTQIVGTVAGALGVVAFQTYMSTWKFREVFWISTAIRIAASVFDIVIVERWNVAVGVPDRWAYLLGDAIVYQICYMLNFMPNVVLTSKVCPKHMEATVYALLAGFQNFGQQLAKSAGVYMMSSFGIRTEGSDCNFEGLTTMLFVGHMLVPALLIPITFFMVPDIRLNESMDDGGGGRGAEDEQDDEAERGDESESARLVELASVKLDSAR